MIVVLVLMTNCQVSEYLNTGPVTTQMKIIKKAIPNALELPVHAVTLVDILSKKESFLFSIDVIIIERYTNIDIAQMKMGQWLQILIIVIFSQII